VLRVRDALHNFATYILGAWLGPVGMGWLSNYFAGGGPIMEAPKALSLHRTMYAIPLIGLVLAVVLFRAGHDVTKALMCGGFTSRRLEFGDFGSAALRL